jgi:hypothetical protein
MASEQINVDLSALPPNVPSLCIPRVFKNITRERVYNCIKDLGIAYYIDRIDMIPRKSDNGDEFQRVFIHLRWNKSELASKARSRVLAGKEIKIIYDDPWFWKVSANRSVNRDPIRDSRDSHDSRAPRATLALEDDDIEGSIRKVKASARTENGYRPRQHESSGKAGGSRPHHHAKQQMRPMSPSSPPPVATAACAASATASAAACAAACARSPSPSPEVADNYVSPLDVDAPTSTMPTINYGDCLKLPAPKKRRVTKPKMVVEERSDGGARGGEMREGGL